LRERVVAYLGGKCAICGYTYCTAALDAHHIDPLEKDFNISSRMTSWKAIVRELDKCILLCANCHREVHDGLHAGYLDDHDWDRGQVDDAWD
jgi:predicted HNH restriction endonuclease